MALGFVVARFGLFLTLLSSQSASASEAHHSHWVSSVVGIGLLILGAAVILGALWNHRLFIRSLPQEDVPKLPMPWLTSLLAVLVAAIGLALAVYLMAA
jgi:putative membrane protein